MLIIQILIIVFIAFAFSRSILRLKDKEINIQEFIFWSTIWLVAIVIVLIPRITSLISEPLGVGRGIDVVIYLSIILTFYLIFRLYVKTEKINQELSKLIRELAKRKER